MSSTRAGAIPGTHTVGFDGPSDTIELTHAARDRRGFASGRAGGGALDSGPPRLVHHGRRAAVVVSRLASLRSGARLMRIPFTGVGTALITPFKKDGSLDEAAVKRLARRQIDAGVHFLSPCGTTGEAPTLSHKEKLRVVELVVEEANGAGAGAGRGRRLRHARDHRAGARHGAGRRRRPAVGDALLQQADAGGAVSALQGDRRRARRCRSCSTTCRRRTGVNMDVATTARLSRDPEHRRHQGAGRPRPDVRARLGDPRRASWC